MSNTKFTYDIFISYQWGIKEDVIKLHHKLSANGFKIWRDADLQLNNQSLNKQLADKILGSQIFLCLLTRAYCSSANCLKEINYADKSRKTIVYLLVEKLDLEEMGEIGFIMGNSVYIQCYKNMQSWWDDDFNLIKKSLDNNLTVFIFKLIFKNLNQIFLVFIYVFLHNLRKKNTL